VFPLLESVEEQRRKRQLSDPLFIPSGWPVFSS